MAPHLVYLPEVTVDPDKFLADCQDVYDAYGYLVVAVSEGFNFGESDTANTSEQLDEFGHARLGGVAEALADMVEDAIGVRARFDKLGNLQRAFSPCMSKVDADEAWAVGYDAVERAVAGETDIMVTIERTSNEPFAFETATTSLMSVADQTKEVPLEWVNKDQNGVTAEFVEYAMPLLSGAAVELPPGLPTYPVFQKHFVERKLQPYQR
jgi:6-phosphofructokinase 1